MTVMLSMSSIDRSHRPSLARLAFAILMSTPVWAQNAVHEATFSCPAAIDVTEMAAPVSGWQMSSFRVKRKFERISIYNGKNGGQEFELAPDDQTEEHNRITQIWRLGEYRSMNIFLRCRYSGTQVVLSKDVPDSFKTCTFTFESDKRGKITGASSFVCN